MLLGPRYSIEPDRVVIARSSLHRPAVIALALIGLGSLAVGVSEEYKLLLTIGPMMMVAAFLLWRVRNPGPGNGRVTCTPSGLDWAGRTLSPSQLGEARARCVRGARDRSVSCTLVIDVLGHAPLEWELADSDLVDDTSLTETVATAVNALLAAARLRTA